MAMTTEARRALALRRLSSAADNFALVHHESGDMVAAQARRVVSALDHVVRYGAMYLPQLEATVQDLRREVTK